MGAEANMRPPAETETTIVLGRGALCFTAAILLFNVVIVGILLCYALPHHLRVVVDNLTQCIGPLIASLVCFAKVVSARLRAAKLGEEQYPAVVPAICFSIAALCFSIGQSIWSWYELKLNIPTPFPSWADAGYLCAYPFLFLGIFALPSHSLSIHKRIVILFECLMLMVGVVTFSWYFVLGPTVLQTGETLVAKILGTAYPLSDIGLIFSLLMLFIRSDSPLIKSVLVRLAVGLVSIITIDTVFDYQTLHNTYMTGHVFDVGWTFGYMLIADAGYSSMALKADPSAVEPEIRAKKRLSSKFLELSSLTEFRPLLVQYLVVALVAALVWQSSRPTADHRLEIGVHVGAAIIVALLLMRQFFMILENRSLTRKLVAFSENLEEVVEQRTKELGSKTDQLMALQSLTAAINETLDTAKVMAATSVQVRSAFNADAVAVWLCEGTSSNIELVPRSCDGMDENAKPMRIAAECALKDSSDVQTLIVKTEDEDDRNFEYLQGPLLSHGIVLGKIGILRASGGFSISEMQLFDSIGLHVGTALDNAKQFWNARDAADRDPVTGLLNHRAILEYLDTAIELETVIEEPLTVILADIDNFHMFNDTYGHPIGDDVLCKIANIFDAAISVPCKVGRYRGDEYLLVLPGMSVEDSIALAKTLQNQISDLNLNYGDEERTIPTSVSFGLASFPTDSTDRQDLLVTANSNLSSAKNSDARIVALSEMQRAHRELRVSSSFKMLDGMVTAVDNKDRYTRRHSEDVTDFALWIADELGLSQEEKQVLRTGGLLHDVGKIGIPDEILHKPGRLDDEEYTVMKQHPVLGALIVGGVAGMDDIIDIVKHHHEHWDGTGYPDSLTGESIPFNARLVAVADAMSAMTTDRPYRKGMSMATALAEVRRATGTQFDPSIAAAFLRVAEARMRSASGEEATTEKLKAA